MKKILDKIMPTDKIQHWCFGWIIANVFIAGLMFCTPARAAIFGGWAIAGLAGLLKEIVYDWWMKKGEMDSWDIIATSAGGLCAAAWFSIFIW